MPGYKFHLIIGIITFFIVSYLLRLTLFFIMVTFPICLLMSIAPDVDHNMGKIRKYSIITLCTLILISFIITKYIYLIPFFVILILVIFFSKHRQWFHSWIAGLIIASPTLMLNWKSFILCFCCYMSHIMIDIVYSKCKRVIEG